LVRIVAQFGSDAVAGYTIAIRVVIFTFLPAWGLSTAVATLVGQCLGAGNKDRAEKAVWTTVKVNVAFMLVTGLLLFVFAEVLIRFFSDEPTVTFVGIYTLRIISLGYGFFALGMVLINAFNGAGDTATPTRINFVCFWLIQIPFAYIAANWFSLGTPGVALSVTLAEMFVAGLTFWQFRKGKWKGIKL